MTNRFLVSVAAVALIAGTSAANAQGGMNRESGGGAATQQSAPSGESSAGGATTPKSTEPSGRPGMTSTQSEQQKLPGAVKGQRAEEPGQTSKSRSTENEPKGAAKDMKAEGRDGRDKNMKAEGREGRDSNSNAQRTDERSQTTTGQAAASAKLSTEQRTQITTVIRNERVAPANNVDFQISIGTRVPRERISLRPLPAEVITIYPRWRGYEFFLVRDQIVVVDPRTGEIVDVLPV
jgi:hypothetical protein